MTAGALGTEVFDQALGQRGIQMFTGVPCSYLSGPLTLWQSTGRYIAAANEGAALAIACGFTLAGRPCAVAVQNSGLGNLVNPLASLAAPYGIGILMLISHRGDPNGPSDEPQHRLMGEATIPLLDALGTAHWRLPSTEAELGPVLDAACEVVRAGRQAALVIGKGVLQAAPRAPSKATSERPAPAEVIAVLSEMLEDELVVSTTGFTSRWLFDGLDQPGNFYMQGSMGHAISIGLGTSLARPDRRVFVLDGDGACLMHLGALGSAGQQAPRNLVHVVLDNGQYESTGGQPGAAVNARFDDAARALGYRWTGRAGSLNDIRQTLAALDREQGPALLVIEVAAGGDAPPRATASLSPETIRARFAGWAQRTGASGTAEAGGSPVGQARQAKEGDRGA
jgi:phosphonopyruvate decarboxylase